VRRPSRFSHFHGFRILAFPRISHFHAFCIHCTFRIFAYFAYFAHFTFQIPRVFAHLTKYAHLVILHSLHSRTHISRRFRILVHFAYFALSRISRFNMCYCAPPWDPSHSVHMSCPHPPWSIGAYLTWFHLHYITYVFAFTFMFIYLIMCLYYITLVCLALLTRLRGLGTRLAC
jgi:hypothetical protein